jgi:hypothetical protein
MGQPQTAKHRSINRQPAERETKDCSRTTFSSSAGGDGEGGGVGCSAMLGGVLLKGMWINP